VWGEMYIYTRECVCKSHTIITDNNHTHTHTYTHTHHTHTHQITRLLISMCDGRASGADMRLLFVVVMVDGGVWGRERDDGMEGG
jgi:hypothetical protein